MILEYDPMTTEIHKLIRSFEAGIMSGSLAHTFYSFDDLTSVSIERLGNNSKFFGFGIAQKIKVQIQDRDRKYDIDNTDHFSFIIKSGSDYGWRLENYPRFFVDTVERDENTNALTITAYDCLQAASAIKISEIGLEAPYTIRDVLTKIATALGTSVDTYPSSQALNLSYPTGANLSGEETLREVLDAIAEATQSIYFINDMGICFIQLANREDGYIIDKAQYITLKSEGCRKLSTITSASDLGDNVSATTGEEGEEQIVKNNPFWDLREDIADILEEAIAAIGGVEICEFECDWRGHPMLMPGDPLRLITKDDREICSFMISDTLTYNGGVSQKTEWKYGAGDSVESNSTTIGEAIKETYARVDKANKRIEMVASEADGIEDRVSTLEINTESINASVSKIGDLEDQMNEANEAIGTLQQSASLAMTPEKIQAQITETLSTEGASKVQTSTGITLDAEGLTVDKTNSEMTTTISDDGMKVKKAGEEMLVANHNGVNAANLHATTYLIIGENSRFEDYTRNGEARTGCFWIGG